MYKISLVLVIWSSLGISLIKVTVINSSPNSTSKPPNVNPPYFDQSLYETEVNENELINHTVITITAKDKDESTTLRYEITRGNMRGAFGVNSETGDLYVNNELDYEFRREYKLRFYAFDGLNGNYTTVVIRIIDMNDNPPQFDKQLYETTISVKDIIELPKTILRVTASDPDWDRPQHIVYFIIAIIIRRDHYEFEDPNNGTFAINETTGDIYVQKLIDPYLTNGILQWNITVYAIDEGGNGLVGFADVIVVLQYHQIANSAKTNSIAINIFSLFFYILPFFVKMFN